MISRAFLLAAAGLCLLPAAPAARAGEVAHLTGGCPAIAGRADCPAASHDPVLMDYPQNAQPGQCFAQVRTAPVIETYSEQVLVSPGRTDQKVIDAVYEWEDKQVLVSPARVERHEIPATYRTVTETVVVTPATVRVERSEPVYETISEKVMVRAARTEWRRTFVGPDGVIPEGARVTPTGEVICLVEIPAEYTTQQRQVLRESGRSVEIPVPAVTREVTRQVIDQPARFEETRIPAVYRTEKVRREVRAARTESVVIAPVYATQQKQREVSPGVLKWVLADCGTKQPVDPR